MFLNYLLGSVAGLSLLLLLWQWLAALRFPLHQPLPPPSTLPPVSLLKPLKGADDRTAKCLQSWFQQEYPASLQILFGVAESSDAACEIVNRLVAEFPQVNARLIVCHQLDGANAKVAKLAQLEKLATHEVVAISDADVWVEPHFLTQLIAPLARNDSSGLVNCFYELAEPRTLAMRWEALAINGDFWSQVLQSKDLKPLDFALGAVMATRKKQLRVVGGFEAIADCLADDYQLGNRIARAGYRIELCPITAQCLSAKMGWRGVWKHQLRWARTIRVSQPVPYFFSILSNPILWPFTWALIMRSNPATCVLAGAILIRIISAFHLQRRLTKHWPSPHTIWLAPVKDLLQAALWLLAFAGNSVEWRGKKMRLRKDGTLK